ncbi:MAG: hypothetical protein OK457_07600 [Thaumarchaeota archaeon]|nr:hypothetical protein [Nitrososphaerota archaeon]
MQTQTQTTEVLGEIRGKTVTRTIKDITPLGVRLELNNEGKFVGGKYTSDHIETVSVFQNLDGSFEWEAKGLDVTTEGDTFVTSGRGTGKATGPATIWAEGNLVYMTQAPKLAWLNTSKARAVVTANNQTGEFEIKVYSK